MANVMNLKLGNSLLIRSGVVLGAILAVTGFATGVIPVKCLVGKACAPVADNAIVDNSPPSDPAIDTAQLAPAAAASSQMPSPELVADIVPPKPTLTSNDVIASTFALLPAELQKPALDAGSAKPKPLTANSTAPANGDLKTRRVKTVTIKADGTPLLPDELVAQAYANPTPAVGKPVSPAIDAATRISAGEEPLPSAEPSSEPAPEAKSEPKPTKVASTGPTGKSGTIAGSGSNVRAAPSKSGKVLFVLAGGSPVKIGENSKGWIKVTDSRGRSGWVYKTFIN